MGKPNTPYLHSITPTATSLKRLITSRSTGAGSLTLPIYSEAWAKGNAKARHWVLMSAHGSTIKQLAFTPLDSWVTSGQQLSMGSAPGRHRAFVPWLTIPEGTLFQSTFDFCCCPF
ncbi:hypothetical protein TNCV_2600211 [Trichonephila clavipes]|nr:hypothetical protein TNCV_2600211 [Trichonephila clavipes]